MKGTYIWKRFRALFLGFSFVWNLKFFCLIEIVVLTCLFLITFVVPGSSRAKRDEPVATVLTIKGNVSVTQRGDKHPAEKKMAIFLKDVIETGKDSMVEIFISENYLIVLNENTIFSSEAQNDEIKYVIKSGQLRAIIDRYSKTGIAAGDALIIAGKAEIDILVNEDGNSQLHVLNGRTWWIHQKWSIRKSLTTGEFIIWHASGVLPQVKEDIQKVKQKTEWYPVIGTGENKW